MRASFFSLVFSFLFCLNGQGQNCLPNGITFSTQAEIDNFPINYPGCTVIEGNVEISSISFISNLNGLSALTAIGGGLTIHHCSALPNLSGLQNMTTIGGDLIINNCPVMNDIGGLQNIASIGGNLRFHDLSGIASLSALGNVTMLGGDLSISGMQLLTSLNGLQNITSIGGSISLSNLPKVTSLSTLGNVATVGGGLGIYYMQMLTSLDGLQNITFADGNSLIIINNAALTSLTSIGHISTIGVLQITGNDALTNLNGLENITALGVGNHIISDNPSMTDIGGLKNTTSIGGSLELSNLPQVESLSALSNVTTIEYGLTISNMPLLTSLDGLQNSTIVQSEQVSIRNNQLLASLSKISNFSRVTGLEITGNPLLTDLDGLQNLTIVDGSLFIFHNSALTSLNGLQNLTTAGGEGLYIANNAALTSLDGIQSLAWFAYLDVSSNQSLTDCAIYAICAKFLDNNDLGPITIANNAPGCNSPAEVASQCTKAYVVVEVQTDDNSDCSSGTPVPDLQVQLKGTAQMTIKPTDANGVASFNYLESGPFTLVLPEVNAQNWSISQFTQTLTASDGRDSFHVFLCLSPLTQCPELTATLGLPSNFRGCLVNSDIQISAQNTGTVLAEGVKMAVVMPPVFELLGSAPLVSFQNGDTLFFEMGDLKPFEKAKATLTVKTKCDTFLLEQTLCWETFAAMDNPCPKTPIAFSEIKLSAECVGDTIVRLGLKNIGDAPTQGWHAYKIIRNDEILYDNGFSLNAQQSLSFDFAADGATWRMEATKFDDGTPTAIALENCGGLTPGYINAFWLDEGPIDYDFDCRQVIGSYDPNRKTAVPTGVGWQGVIAPNQPLQYTIDFQNTGTDTAYRVLLRDELPTDLDINTFRPEFSSHPCTWEINGNRLEVLFFPIALPDSNVNEPASRGFFNFTIDQKTNLPDGTSFYNSASIIFDFNPPIVTNYVQHTIGKLTVRVDEAQPNMNLWRVWGNPIRDAAIFRSEEFIAGEKRFELYDVAGRLVRSAQFSGQEYEFQRDVMPAGLYFFRIGDAQGRRFTGKIVVAE